MRRPSPLFLAVMLALAGSVIAAQPKPPAKVTVFERARVIIGDGVHPWIEDAAFVVEGTYFTQVGRRGTLKIPRGAVRVNLAGKTVMPGIIDTLAHISATRDLFQLPAELSPEAYQRTIDEAHAKGLRVMARVRTLEDAKNLLRAGVDVLVGVPREPLDRETINLFRTRRNVVVIADLSERGSAEFTAQVPNLGRLGFEKQPIALGSDSSEPSGYLQEMEDMAAALLPFDVITAAGHTAAQLLGLKDQGAIAAGNVANFLVLDGNPAMDIKQIRNINAIYVRGAAVKGPATAARQ